MRERQIHVLLNIRSNKGRIIYEVTDNLITFISIYFLGIRPSIENGLKPIYFLCIVPPIVYNLIWYFVGNLRRKSR